MTQSMERKQRRYDLYDTVVEFFTNQKVTCKETIYQSDRVIENAYDLLADLFDIVKSDLKIEIDNEDMDKDKERLETHTLKPLPILRPPMELGLKKIKDHIEENKTEHFKKVFCQCEDLERDHNRITNDSSIPYKCTNCGKEWSVTFFDELPIYNANEE